MYTKYTNNPKESFETKSSRGYANEEEKTLILILVALYSQSILRDSHEFVDHYTQSASYVSSDD